MDEAKGDWFRRYVREAEGRCPSCRGMLGEVRDFRCASCGTRLELGLAAREGYLAPWGTFLAGAALTAGFGMFLGLIWVLRGRIPGPGTWFSQGVFITIVGLGPIMGLVMVGVLFLRRLYCRMPKWVQWGLAMCAVCLALVVTGFFMATMR